MENLILTRHPIRSDTVFYLLIPVIAIISVLPFSASLYGDFVWDDILLVRDNRHIGDPDFFSKIWFLDYFDGFNGSRSHFWRPLVILSLGLDYRIHGADPFGFHLTNLILFALTAAVAFVFFRQVFSDYVHRRKMLPGGDSGRNPVTDPLQSSWSVLMSSVAASLVFAWHPLRTEIAGWISARTETMVLLFGLAALCMFGRSLDDSHRVRRLTLVSACLMLCLSLLSKESAVLFPLLALIVYGSRIRRHIAAWFLFWTPVIAWLILRHFAVGYRHWFPQTVDPLLIPAAAARAFRHYLSVQVVPYGLSPEPWFPFPATYADASVLAGLALAAGIIFVFVRFRNPVTAGAFWFLVALTPFLQVLPLPERAADRYATIASIGFSLFLAGVPLTVSNRAFHRIWTFLLLIPAVVWAFESYQLVPSWQSDYTIMVRSAFFGKSPQALFYRGDKEFMEQNFEAAYEAYFLALDRSESPSAVQLYHLALSELETDRIDHAVEHLKRVLEIEPKHPVAGTMLAEIYIRQKQYNDAIRILESQVQIHPGNALPHLLLGFIYGDFLDQPDRGRRYFEEAMKRDTRGIHTAVIQDRLGRRQ